MELLADEEANQDRIPDDSELEDQATISMGETRVLFLVRYLIIL